MITYDTVIITKYNTAKQYTPANGSSMGAYRWCNHLANASEALMAMALLLFQLLLVAVQPC